MTVCQARAVAHGRTAPGRFADPTAMPLLRAEEQALVHLVRKGTPPKGMAERFPYELVRGAAELIVPRTVAIDDAARAGSATQVVLLGAGLDGRAWRLEMPGATFFEVDHPASQEEKRDRATSLTGTPPTYVPVDFAHDVLTAALAAAGHRADRPTTWIWEGVVPYLTREEVAATVAAVAASSAAGSLLIVNYQLPTVIGDAVRKVIGLLAGRQNPWAAEPWLSAWSVRAMAGLLARHGFAVRSDQDLLEIADDLGVRLGQRNSMRNSRVAIAER